VKIQNRGLVSEDELTHIPYADPLLSSRRKIVNV
jgi:hypothetical protein